MVDVDFDVELMLMLMLMLSTAMMISLSANTGSDFSGAWNIAIHIMNPIVTLTLPCNHLVELLKIKFPVLVLVASLIGNKITFNYCFCSSISEHVNNSPQLSSCKNMLMVYPIVNKFADLKDGLYDLWTDDRGGCHPTKLPLVNETIIVRVKDPEKNIVWVKDPENNYFSRS